MLQHIMAHVTLSAMVLKIIGADLTCSREYNPSRRSQGGAGLQGGQRLS